MVKEAGSFSITDVNVQTSEVIQQIMSQMKVRMKGGATSMRLLLNPKELGEIEVQMVRNTQGVSVTFIAEQANTGKMLEIQINQLRQSLKDAGVQLTDLNFSQHDQPKQEGGFLRQSPQFSQYLPASTPQTEIVNKALDRPERIDGLSNEVDYLI
ncbi:MAG: flagellar hook-length control protein FliK [Anaerolineales bacterium]|nr:flagellar hook-length control protein FliK [Anaerolineales bacterium]